MGDQIPVAVRGAAGRMVPKAVEHADAATVYDPEIQGLADRQPADQLASKWKCR